MENRLLNIILSLAVLAGVIVMAIFAFMYLGLKQKEVENEARYQCAQSSRYEINNGKNTIWYPAADLYSACLREKGIE